MKIKGRLMILALFLGLFVNIAMLGAVSASNVDVNSNMSNLQIQSVLDNAKSGDTINFLGQFYENIQLTINKTLHIMTSVGTVLSGSNSPGSAVFLVNGSKASGTTISGFNITNSREGVFINNTNWTTLTNNRIKSINGSAVTVNGSQNTNLESNNLTYSNTGVTVYKSKNIKITNARIAGNKYGVVVNNSENTAINNGNVVNSGKHGVGVYNSANTTVNNTSIKSSESNAIEIHNSNRTVINNSQMTGNGKGLDPGYVDPDTGSSKEANGCGLYVEKSDKVKILNSNVSENFRGMSATSVSNLTIENNSLIGNNFEGILLSGIIKTGLIKGNILQVNNNGIKLNCRSYNLTIIGNVMTYNERKCSGCANGHGLILGGSFQEDGTTIVKHNIITKNTYPYSAIFPGVGSNFYGDSDYESYLRGSGTTNMKLELIKTGENKYAAYFTDGDTGEMVIALPPVSIIITTSDGRSFTIQLQDGLAEFTTDANDITATMDTSTTLPDYFRPSLISALNEIVAKTIQSNSETTNIPIKAEYSYSDWDSSDIDQWENEVPPNTNDPDSEVPPNTNDPDSEVPPNTNDPDSEVPPNTNNPDSEDNTDTDNNSNDNSNTDGSGSKDNSNTGGNSNSGNNGNNPGTADGTGQNGDNSGNDGSTAPEVNLPTGITALTAAAVSVASSMGQEGSNGDADKTVQELLVDEVNKPEVWGIIGILVLLFLVFGAYYRTDLVKMIRKSKK